MNSGKYVFAQLLQLIYRYEFDRTPLRELLTEYQINQNVKEQRNLFSH